MRRSIRPSFRRSNYYLRQVLKYNTPLLYRGEIYDLIYADGETWDFKHGADNQNLNVTPDLAQAMTYNPRLKVFSANGYFDFATPFFATVYALQHLYLAPAIQRNITYGFYQSGHMVYLAPARARALPRRPGALVRVRIAKRVIPGCVEDDVMMRRLALAALASSSIGRSPRTGATSAARRKYRRRDAAHDHARRKNLSVYGARRHDRAREREGRNDVPNVLHRVHARRRRPAHASGDVPLQRRPGQFDDLAAHGLVRSRARASRRCRADAQRAVQSRSRTSTRCSIVPTSSSSTRPTPASAASCRRANPSDFFGVDQDVRAFAQFVSRYITTFGRWNSPKFLFGESYGTPRSAMLVNYLAAGRHRHQRRRAALVDPRLLSRLGSSTSRRRRSAAAIGRFRSIFRPKRPHRGTITRCPGRRRR